MQYFVAVLPLTVGCGGIADGLEVGIHHAHYAPLVRYRWCLRAPASLEQAAAQGGARVGHFRDQAQLGAGPQAPASLAAGELGPKGGGAGCNLCIRGHRCRNAVVRPTASSVHVPPLPTSTLPPPAPPHPPSH